MVNVNIKLHKYQIEILKKLVKTSGLRFNQLLIKGLESEHMNYHLKQIVTQCLVSKKGNIYTLTDHGKEYMNRLGDSMEVVEKQPKMGVLLRCLRKNKKGDVEFLLTKRLVQPYLGKVGRLTGKIRFGEKAIDTAKRELFEETGLTAKNFYLERIYRKVRVNESNETVQDVIFYTFLVTDFSGTFISKTEVQENFWLTKEDALKEDIYEDLSFNEDISPQVLEYVENYGVAQGY